MIVKMENAAFALFIKFQFFINEETIFKAATRVTEEEKDGEKGWNQWLQRAPLFKQRQQDDLW